MRPDQLGDLAVFAAIASDRSFTRAAKRLGVTQSALSQTMKRLEGQLGFRLLSRTTRSVAPTAAGERLLATLSPALAGLDDEIEALVPGTRGGDRHRPDHDGQTRCGHSAVADAPDFHARVTPASRWRCAWRTG